MRDELVDFYESETNPPSYFIVYHVYMEIGGITSQR